MLFFTVLSFASDSVQIFTIYLLIPGFVHLRASFLQNEFRLQSSLYNFSLSPHLLVFTKSIVNVYYMMDVNSSRPSYLS